MCCTGEIQVGLWYEENEGEYLKHESKPAGLIR